MDESAVKKQIIEKLIAALEARVTIQEWESMLRRARNILDLT